MQLPEGWSEIEVQEDEILADGIELRRVGVASISPTGETVTGSAAGVSTYLRERALFELYERVATVSALRAPSSSYPLVTKSGEVATTADAASLFPESAEPSRWRYARSNGVAIHRDFESAAQRACWELAERDRVLRSWFGGQKPEPLAFDRARTPLRSSRSYDFRAYHFGRADFAPEADVVGVFGFPSSAGEPLALGFAARAGVGDAFDAALAEALQSLAFLWGEPVPNTPPPLGPSPMHHLEHYQYAPHRAWLRQWLDGQRVGVVGGAEGVTPTPRGEAVLFVTLTPPWLPDGMSVVKATCADATPLVFGEAPFLARLPAEARVHPVA